MEKVLLSLFLMLFHLSNTINKQTVFDFKINVDNETVSINSVAVNQQGYKVAKVEYHNLTYFDNAVNVEQFDNMLVIYDDLENTLNNLKFNIVDKTQDSNIKISIYNRDIKIIKYNNEIHYYEYIMGEFTFNEALKLAATHHLDQLNGYLATITNELEQKVINSFLPYSGWGGGTCGVFVNEEYIYDAVTCGTYKAYRWISGPDEGIYFNHVSDQYHNFNENEPNDANGKEVFLKLNHFKDGTWNDIDEEKIGYFIEFSEYNNQQIIEDVFHEVKIDKLINSSNNPVITSDPVITNNLISKELESEKSFEEIIEPKQTLINTTKTVVKEEVNTVKKVEKEKQVSITLVSNIGKTSTNQPVNNLNLTNKSQHNLINETIYYSALSLFWLSSLSLIFVLIKYFVIGKIFVIFRK